MSDYIIFSPDQTPQHAINVLNESQNYSPSFVAFDMKQDGRSATELADWVKTFNQLYHTQVIDTHKGFMLPSIAVFSDRFNVAEEKILEAVGVILFDRSLPCNHDCQTPEQLESSIKENHNIKLSGDSRQAEELPKPPLNGISAEDLQALNSYPPGMSAEKVAEILRVMNTHDDKQRFSQR